MFDLLICNSFLIAAPKLKAYMWSDLAFSLRNQAEIWQKLIVPSAQQPLWVLQNAMEDAGYPNEWNWMWREALKMRQNGIKVFLPGLGTRCTILVPQTCSLPHSTWLLNLYNTFRGLAELLWEEDLVIAKSDSFHQASYTCLNGNTTHFLKSRNCLLPFLFCFPLIW